MPELPDLEVIREFLAPRLVGTAIAGATVRRAIVVRNLLGGELGDHVAGKCFRSVTRRGKFLLFGLEPELTLVVNPMLMGRLRYGEPLRRDRSRDALVLALEGGRELRYNDTVDMGKIYLTRDLAQIPTFSEQGPEADEPALTLDVFRERLRRQSGEIKLALTRQSCVAGIGNAYADEILWHAQLSPFRKCQGLSTEEQAQLYASMRAVLAEAIVTLRERVGGADGAAIDVEVRDFLAVHGKPGQACPRCGNPISEVTRERRATHFCRTCQPGLLIDRR
jgi:formamidopyrimidine-DNA glycosylase